MRWLRGKHQYLLKTLGAKIVMHHAGHWSSPSCLTILWPWDRRALWRLARKCVLPYSRDRLMAPLLNAVGQWQGHGGRKQIAVWRWVTQGEINSVKSQHWPCQQRLFRPATVHYNAQWQLGTVISFLAKDVFKWQIIITIIKLVNNTQEINANIPSLLNV